MPDTYHDHLITRAYAHWDNGRRLPADLFTEMLCAGLDVDALERQHTKEA